MTLTTLVEFSAIPHAPGQAKPEWRLITLLEFVHAIAELPDCNRCGSDTIRIPNHGARESILRNNPSALPRPEFIIFTKVYLEETYGPGLRWALSEEYRLLA